MLAEFPMVEEAAATGRVAAVYADAASRAPFVPSILKSLAVCPPYLVLAWNQVGPLLGEADLAQAAAALAGGVTDVAEPPADAGDRDLLGGFVGPLSTMSLVCAGLLAALDGELPGRPSATGDAPPPPDEPLEGSVPSTGDLGDDAELLGRIRAQLGTPIVNSIWRKAAAEGRLQRIWDQLGPQAAATRAAAERLQQRAEVAARDVPWPAVADRPALARAGIADAEAGVRAVLDAYAITLPRVLVLAASSGGDR